MEYPILTVIMIAELSGILHAVGPRLRCRDINANPTTTLCCNGIVYMRSGVNPACCGYIGFDNTDSICCDNKVLPRRGLVPRCCGDRAYDSSKDVCLNGIVQQPEWAPKRPKDSSYDSKGIVRKSGFRPACCWIRNRNVRGDCCATIKQKTGMLPACCDSPGLRPVCCLDIYSSLVCCNKRHPTCCPDTPDPDQARRLAGSFVLPTAQVQQRIPETRPPYQGSYLYYTRTAPPIRGSAYQIRTLPWPLVDEVPTDSYGRKLHMNGQAGTDGYDHDKEPDIYITRYNPNPTPYHRNPYTSGANSQRPDRNYDGENNYDENDRYNVDRYDNRVDESDTPTENPENTRPYPVDMDGSGDERLPVHGVPVVEPSPSWYYGVQRDRSYGNTKRVFPSPPPRPSTTEAVRWRPSCCLSVKIQVCCTMITWRTGVKPECCENVQVTKAPSVSVKHGCQRRAFNQRTHICCEGKLRRRIGVRPACCAHVAYDALVFECCDGTVRRSCERSHTLQKSAWPGYYVR